MGTRIKEESLSLSADGAGFYPQGGAADGWCSLPQTATVLAYTKHSIHMIRSITFGLLLFTSSAWADTFRVHYSIRGSARNVTVQADSSGEARRTVMDMFPGALVTGVHQIRK